MTANPPYNQGGYEFCPHCKADLKDSPIPEKDREAFGGNWFKREMGIYDMGKDRTVDEICPDCNKSLWGKQEK